MFDRNKLLKKERASVFSTDFLFLRFIEFLHIYEHALETGLNKQMILRWLIFGPFYPAFYQCRHRGQIYIKSFVQIIFKYNSSYIFLFKLQGNKFPDLFEKYNK